MILDELFKFPIVMADGDAEESKRNLFSGGKNVPEIDLVEGEGEYPYSLLIGIADRWLPNTKSFENALERKKFDACMVTFANVGSFLCPWPKEQFKKEYAKFVKGLSRKTETVLVRLSDEDVKKLIEQQKKEEDENEQEG